MNISDLSDQELVVLTKKRVALERQSALDVIECLREIFRRRVHLALSYPSLHVFCVKELGFSDSEAYTRLHALKLLEDVPETRESLGDGTLSLAKAAQIQSFFRRQEKRDVTLERVAKKAIIEKLQIKSGREIERALVTLGLELGDREIQMKESARLVAPQVTELKLFLHEDLIQKLEKLRSLLSHKLPNATYAELIEEMAELSLSKLDPERAKNFEKRKDQRKAPGPLTTQATKPKQQAAKPKQKHASPNTTRYIPTKIRRRIWREDQGKCQFTYGSRVCGSKHRLQIEHKIPWAKGGENLPENLELLCAAHNLHKARREFGDRKIDFHIRVPSES